LIGRRTRVKGHSSALSPVATLRQHYVCSRFDFVTGPVPLRLRLRCLFPFSRTAHPFKLRSTVCIATSLKLVQSYLSLRDNLCSRFDYVTGLEPLLAGLRYLSVSIEMEGGLLRTRRRPPYTFVEVGLGLLGHAGLNVARTWTFCATSELSSHVPTYCVSRLSPKSLPNCMAKTWHGLWSNQSAASCPSGTGEPVGTEMTVFLVERQSVTPPVSRGDLSRRELVPTD